MEDKYWIPTVQHGGQNLDVYSAMLIDGIIFINAPIDQRIAGLVTSCLMQIYARTEQAQTPKIYLNTRQGDILAALTIVDIIEFYKRKESQIQTVAFGEVGAASAIVLAAGTRGLRKMAAHGQICLRISAENLQFGSVQGEQAKARQEGKTVATLIDLLVSYSNLKNETDRIRSYLTSEQYIDASSAKECGFIDEVI